MVDLLVGREKESSALDSFLSDAVDGSPAVLVRGEPGIGKSTLVRAFLERARAAGAVTVSCGGLPDAGGDLPFAPVAQLVRGLRRGHPDVLSESMSPRDRSVLSLLDSRLGDQDVTAGGQEPGLERARLLTTVAGLLERITSEHTVVVFVDDVQWVDNGTLGLLKLLARAAPSAGLLLVMSARVSGVPDDIRRWLAIERATGTLTVIDVPPLTPEQTGQLMTSLGPKAPEPRRVTEVHRLSGGNPLLIRELARSQPDMTPRSVGDLVLSDFSVLPASGRLVVGVVAVAGRPIEHGLVAQVLGPTQAEQGSRLAVESGLLWVEGDRYGVSHELIRNALVEGMLPAERQAHHARLALALSLALNRRANGLHDAKGLAEVAWHFSCTQDVDASVQWSLRAAAEAERIGAFAAAHTQLRRVVQATDIGETAMSAGDRLDVLRRAAVAADRAGDHTAALTYLDEALASTPEPGAEDRSLLQAHRSWVLMVLHRMGAAYASASTAVAGLPESAGPAVRARVLLNLAMLHNDTDRLDEARQVAREALTAARQAGDDALIGRAMLHLSNAEPLTGPADHALELLGEAWRRALAAGDPEDVAAVGVSVTDRLTSLGRHAEAVELGREAREALVTLAEGTHWLDGMLAANTATSLLALGRWDEAAVLLEEVIAQEEFGWGRVTRARLRVLRGDLEGAEADLEATRRLQRRDAPGQGLYFDEYLVELRLWQHRPVEALETVYETVGELPALAIRERGRLLCVLGLRAAADLADEGEGRGRPISSHHAVLAERLAAIADDALTGDRLLRALADGELSRLRRRPDPDVWAVAARTCGATEPHLAAYAWWRHAEALLEAGASRSTAAPSLRSASDIAIRLRARLLIEETAALAARARLPLHDGADVDAAAEAAAPDSLGLTQRELAVLRLLMRGRTNREIGHELFMSPKTASVHVTRILDKLGVDNRVQAASVGHRAGLDPDGPQPGRAGAPSSDHK